MTTTDSVCIELLPLGTTLVVERGTELQDVLFAHGVEFPCGGRGRCKGCRVRVLAGSLPTTPEDQRLLAETELVAGWRLACRAQASQNLKLELAQWEAAILDDNTVFAFTPQEGLGIAVDLGTTTIVAQLLDLQTGHVLGVRTGLNVQAQHGADIMSRVEFALAKREPSKLTQLIRTQIGGLMGELLKASGRSASELEKVVIVGNTAMHHLFCGIDIEPLSHYPFEPVNDGLQVFSKEELGWSWAAQASRSASGGGLPAARPAAKVHFLPCLGGFVGSDILAGILATKLHESEELAGLVDLGTNGEIVIGNRERLLCASTAAGPAFEGARISMGMRAATGAISEVILRDGQFLCHVLGHVPPRGICGSGLVDAVACLLETGRLHPTGRLIEGQSVELCPPVVLSQADVRELQLAKGAIAAGIRLLLQQWGASLDQLTRIHLAGAFGNYISRASAQRIGLLPFGPDKVVPAGNTALLGAKLALFSLQAGNASYPDLLGKIQHVSLSADPAFQEIFADEMLFPG